MSATAFQRKRREEAAKIKEIVSTQDNNGKMTVEQIKALLNEKGIEYDARAKKVDLLALLDNETKIPKDSGEEPSEEDENKPPENPEEDENEDAE